MKLTENKIRQLIRKSLREVFEPKESDYEEVSAKTGRSIDDLKANDDLRVTGLQSPEAVRKDRNQMRLHQETYQKGIKEIHQAIMAGEITVMHSLGYSAGTSAVDTDVFKAKSNVDSWIEMSGTKGNHSLSTVIFDIPYGDFKSGNVNITMLAQNASDRERAPGGGSSNNSSQFTRNAITGLILKGYPVISGKYDLGTQTMGSVPSALLKHQSQSGFSKRSMDYNPSNLIKDMQELKEYGGTEETVLDNWQVVAPFMISGETGILGKIKKSGIGSIKLNPGLLDIFMNQEKYLKYNQSLNYIEEKIIKDAKTFGVDIEEFSENTGSSYNTNFSELVSDIFFQRGFMKTPAAEGVNSREDWSSGRLLERILEYYQIDKYEKIKDQLEKLNSITDSPDELLTYFKLLNVSMKYKLDPPVLI